MAALAENEVDLEEQLKREREQVHSEEINVGEWTNFLAAQPRSQKKILGRITRKTGANLQLVRGTFVRIDGTRVQIRRAKRQISMNINMALSTSKGPALTKFIFAEDFRTARIVKWAPWTGPMTEDMELLEDLVAVCGCHSSRCCFRCSGVGLVVLVVVTMLGAPLLPY